MSGRVCYLAREDRSGGPATVRLVGPGSDESWERPGTPEDPGAVVAQTAQAAEWIAQRAAQGDGPRNEIALLCVDVGGASCSWITTPSAEESVVAAALTQNAGDWTGEGAVSGAWSTPPASEASVQALAAPAPPRSAMSPRRARAGTPSKVAVAAVPDVDARLVIDALDERGVSVERSISLWHALALAWDPAGPIAAGSMRASEAAVAATSPTTAIVLIDPAGRLLWAWSRAGELLAAGAIRLHRDRREGDAHLTLAAPEMGRLSADWLAWSVQLGAVPARVLCVGPRPGGEGLPPAALGAALTRAAPGASVDMAVHDDPIGATLHRLAGLNVPADSADGRVGLVSLSRRPGRAHRSMYLWTAICIFALAAALGAVAWRAFGAGADAASRVLALRQAMIEKITKIAQPVNGLQQATLDSSPSAYLSEQLRKKKDALNPSSGLEPAPPILAELEDISYILGNREVEIDDLNLAYTGAMIYVSVDSTEAGEYLKQALDGSPSRCEWNMQPGGSRKPEKRSFTFMGKWKDLKGTKP